MVQSEIGKPWYSTVCQYYVAVVSSFSILCSVLRSYSVPNNKLGLKSRTLQNAYSKCRYFESHFHIHLRMSVVYCKIQYSTVS